MPVNPTNPALPYAITGSNQTTDQSRQRNEQSEKKDKGIYSSKNSNSNSTEENSEDSSNETNHEREVLELRSQIIDSQKVVELIAHRPKYKISPKKLFPEKKSPPQTSQNTDVKKFNKAF